MTTRARTTRPRPEGPPPSPDESSALAPSDSPQLVMAESIDSVRTTMHDRLKSMLAHVRTAVQVELVEAEAAVQEAVLLDLSNRLTRLNDEVGRAKANPVLMPSLRSRAAYLEGMLAAAFRSLLPDPTAPDAAAQASGTAREAVAVLLPNLPR